MSFGQTLREAREARGLTPEKVAADTHILVQIINDMENEIFKRIPAPIYGRGFIRLFAEEVGLDPQPLIQEYMDIINGRRRPPLPPLPPIAARPAAPEVPDFDPVIPPPVDDGLPQAVEVPPLVKPFGSPEVPPPPAETTSPHLWDPDPIQPQVVPPSFPMPISEPDPMPVSEPEPEPVQEPISMPEPEPEPVPPPPPPQPAPAPVPVAPSVSPEVEGLPLFGQSQPAAPASAPAAASSLPPQVDTESILPSSYDDEYPGIGERFRKSINAASSNIVHRAKSIPRRTWRIGLVSIIALLVLVLIVFGCVKLYQATARPAANPCANGVCEVDLPKKPAAATPKAQPQAKPQSKPAAATPTKTSAAAPARSAPKTAPAPGKLRSTGQKVPSLYMD